MGSWSIEVYLRTELIGRTFTCLILLSLVIRVSAIPSSTASSRLSAASGLNGSTAMDLTARGLVGFGFVRIHTKESATARQISNMKATRALRRDTETR